jgi:hypothetical protein
MWMHFHIASLLVMRRDFHQRMIMFWCIGYQVYYHLSFAFTPHDAGFLRLPYNSDFPSSISYNGLSMAKLRYAFNYKLFRPFISIDPILTSVMHLK